MAGFTYSRFLTERIEYIREIQSFLMELENEIHYMGRPLGEALSQYARNRTSSLSEFTGRVYEISINEGNGIDAAWRKGIEEFRKRWPMDQEEWNLLSQMGEVLGKTDRAGQSSFIKMMREKFAVQEKKAEEDRIRKEKLYRDLGILGGLAIVLVLI
ncbi:stage III sporulation protein AB [Thermoclostridium stercorarium]|uniref:stage III sporulation protein AB n=1 Tax=Thermoclostridium stercorarium TaxID=1510 RepID=UPI0022494D26|nr:stage III sporulation protein AB [Thermoclostridium stercorarium]UZQ86139.1 stage III sporulation protein AB [Thermoclostridium stercorarium]